MNKPIRVGRYILCSACVEVWLSDKEYSSCHAVLTKSGFGKIVIGYSEEDKSWPSIVQALTHEALEAAIHLQGAAYSKSNFMILRDKCSSNYRFFFTHEELQVIAKGAGDFLCYCLPDLAAAYDKFVNVLKK